MEVPTSMKPTNRELLAEFVSGHIALSALKGKVSDRLFVLRQDPAMTPEKQELSGLQLCLHEIAEGRRDSFEVYQLAWRLLDGGLAPRGGE